MNNSSLYPDILFHFTREKESLFNILNSTFRVSYAREKIEGVDTVREFAVPMVSFCDLKLPELKVHMGKYGKYGIGLTKEWANRNGLNSVMYINKHCPFTDNFNQSLQS
ncbi:abortive infection system antitoxin AbiGi family protein, partial [Vibrio furnissii]